MCEWCVTRVCIYCEECREERKNEPYLVVDVIGRYAVCTCNKRRLPFYACGVCNIKTALSSCFPGFVNAL